MCAQTRRVLRSISLQTHNAKKLQYMRNRSKEISCRVVKDSVIFVETLRKMEWWVEVYPGRKSSVTRSASETDIQKGNSCQKRAHSYVIGGMEGYRGHEIKPAIAKHQAQRKKREPALPLSSITSRQTQLRYSYRGRGACGVCHRHGGSSLHSGPLALPCLAPRSLRHNHRQVRRYLVVHLVGVDQSHASCRKCWRRIASG